MPTLYADVIDKWILLAAVFTSTAISPLDEEEEEEGEEEEEEEEEECLLLVPVRGTAKVLRLKQF